MADRRRIICNRRKLTNHMKTLIKLLAVAFAATLHAATIDVENLTPITGANVATNDKLLLSDTSVATGQPRLKALSISEVVNVPTLFSSVPDSTFSIAKTSGLQTALDGKQPVGAYFYDIANYASASQRNGTADATSAVQTALNDIETAMIASDGGRYTLWLGDAILRIDGALQTTNGNNAQLTLPALDILEKAQCTLVIKGSTPVCSVFSVIGEIPTLTKGAIIRSTLTTGGGTSPAVIGGKAPTGSSWPFTAINLVVENVVIQTISNPLISALNCEYVHTLDMRDSAVAAGQIQSVAQVTTPTTSTSTAVIGPGINNGAFSKYRNVWALGFYVGFRFNEHTTGEIYPFGCVVGLDCTQANHASNLNRLDAHHCITTVRASGGSSRWVFDTMNIEHAASGAFITTADISDPNDYLEGKGNYAVVLGGVGPDSTFTKTGGTKFEATAMGDNYTPVWSTLSGTSPALTLTGTPQVRTLQVTGNTTITASGYAQGRRYTLYLTGDSVTRNLTWPGWTWLGTAPASIASGKVLKVDLVCAGTSQANAMATYELGDNAVGFAVSDSFTRANNSSDIGTSTSGHTATILQGTWGISSNACYISSASTSGGGWNTAVWDNGSGNATVQADLATTSSGGFAQGLAIRVSDINNMLIVCITESGTLTLYKRIAGTFTALGSVVSQGYTNSQTYTVKAVTSGTSIEIFVGGVSKLTYNTSTGLEAATRNGLTYYAGSVSPALGTFDNLTITTP